MFNNLFKANGSAMLRKFLLLFSLILSVVNFSFGQVSLTSSNLPIVIINTNGQTIPDEPKITADMGIIYNGTGQRNNLSDPYNVYNGKIGIEIRGHSSQMFEKKQYGIELRDENGDDVKAALLGMPEEADWVLNASYIDRSLLRNVLTYKLSNELGRYASRTRFCELVLNGEYRGIYILQERIKRDKNRVDIKKMSKTDISGDAVTGGYIVKIDRVDPGDKYWTSPYPSVLGSTKSPITYVLEYPKESDIVTEQFNYIKEHITLFEKIMVTEFYRDPFAGYYNFIDVDAFIDYYLINEFSKNTDAYRLSTFIYKDRDSENGKLAMGPVWDYDISFGLADYDDGSNPEGWQAYRHYDGLWSSPFWTTSLMIDPVFKNKLAKRWYELNNNILSPATINNFLDENIEYLTEARQRNFARWKDLFNPVIYTWPNKNRFSSYEEEINYLKNWIVQRSSWLSRNLSSDYSFIDWKTPDLSTTKFEIGKEVKLPVSTFIDGVQNITSIKFMTLSGDLTIIQSSDSILFKVLKSGRFVVKGIGMKGSENVSISPEYIINVDPTSAGNNENEIPDSFELLQNYPNPFNPVTVIKYYVAEFSHVQIKVFDLLGREVDSLIDEEKLPGDYQVVFNSAELPSGIYFYRMISQNFSSMKKMILIR